MSIWLIYSLGFISGVGFSLAVYFTFLARAKDKLDAGAQAPAEPTISQAIENGKSPYGADNNLPGYVKPTPPRVE